jgi:hypothetical protein
MDENNPCRIARPRLKYLELYPNVPFVVDLRHLPRLERLYVEYTSAEPIPLCFAPTSNYVSALTKVRLRRVQLTTDELAAVLRGVQCPQLQELCLEHCSVLGAQMAAAPSSTPTSPTDMQPMTVTVDSCDDQIFGTVVSLLPSVAAKVESLRSGV